MSNLVQGVAHEIRNPITTIGGFARRIKKSSGTTGNSANTWISFLRNGAPGAYREEGP